MGKLVTKSFLQIKYIKLHFTIKMSDDAVLPVQKASALRGGMGEMLLRVNCVGNRDCENCEYEPECIVRRIMYSKMRIQPEFMSSGDSVGYVIDCENYQEKFDAGDLLEFDVVLFGRMIVYFGQIVQAFQMLGFWGLGKDHARFQIQGITNSKRERILTGNDIIMSNVKPVSLADYVSYRKKQDITGGKVVFHTPLAIKKSGVFLKEFNIEAILKAAERRIYQLNCYEGINADRPNMEEHIPTAQYLSDRTVSVRRFSNRSEQKIRLDGICGEIEISDLDETGYEILLAGEITHIGKNTSFGFGRLSFIEMG